ncbi:MAG: NTP transferase domain-containing protein [Desulfobulbaceae bacterium]|nr:NTP transferase domain-containing protein [Pseudomonadota bacterium]MCG2749133.1 NTP transferase domain-containing protein [Desulfobulbaceae bacterium]
MKAMILAAGFGTRLRPYSLLRPKPLFPVLDLPLILRHIAQLREAGCDAILVNCHHLREQIVDLLAGLDGIFLQQEPIELGTGGGMRMARDFFGSEPVLVINGDIFHTIDLARVYQEHCSSGADATLVLHDCPRFNNVSVDDKLDITAFGAGGSARKMAFTGIHVLDPNLLSVITPGIFYNIIDCYRYWIARGKKIRAHVVHDHFWTDMGTPEDYLDLHRVLLTREPFKGASPFYYGSGVAIPADLQSRDWLCVGAGARIGRHCRLSRVVVWNGAQVPDGTILEDVIVV